MRSDLTQAAVEAALLSLTTDGQAIGNSGGSLTGVDVGGGGGTSWLKTGGILAASVATAWGFCTGPTRAGTASAPIAATVGYGPAIRQLTTSSGGGFGVYDDASSYRRISSMQGQAPERCRARFNGYNATPATFAAGYIRSGTNFASGDEVVAFIADVAQYGDSFFRLRITGSGVGEEAIKVTTIQLSDIVGNDYEVIAGHWDGLAQVHVIDPADGSVLDSLTQDVTGWSGTQQMRLSVYGTSASTTTTGVYVYAANYGHEVPV